MLLLTREDAIVAELMDRITVDTEQCGGRPCIRGMRIRVADVLDLLAAGLTIEQIHDELPYRHGRYRKLSAPRASASRILVPAIPYHGGGRAAP
jgi:hypothetical protein